jgi:hypothetical protein
VIQWMTWLSVAILGPGAAAIFVWFLLDLRKIFGRHVEPPSRQGDSDS